MIKNIWNVLLLGSFKYFVLTRDRENRMEARKVEWSENNGMQILSMKPMNKISQIYKLLNVCVSFFLLHLVQYPNTITLLIWQNFFLFELVFFALT